MPLHRPVLLPAAAALLATTRTLWLASRATAWRPPEASQRR